MLLLSLRYGVASFDSGSDCRVATMPGAVRRRTARVSPVTVTPWASSARRNTSAAYSAGSWTVARSSNWAPSAGMEPLTTIVLVPTVRSTERVEAEPAAPVVAWLSILMTPVWAIQADRARLAHGAPGVTAMLTRRVEAVVRGDGQRVGPRRRSSTGSRWGPSRGFTVGHSNHVSSATRSPGTFLIPLAAMSAASRS